MSRLSSITFLICSFVSVGTIVANDRSLLPEGQNIAVVELWYVYDCVPSHPEIVVLADGRMQIMSPEGPQRSELTSGELHELLKGLVVTDGLDGISTEALSAQIKQASMQTGLTSLIDDAGETVIRLRTANGSKEIRCPAVGILANRFPEIEELQIIAACQRRLENIRAIATVGGAKEAEMIAETAQRALEAEYGVEVPVNSRHLAMVRALPDGSRFCQFLVAADDSPRENVQMISVVETPGYHPRVSMFGGDTVTR